MLVYNSCMSDNHTDLVLEDMNSKFDAVVELVSQIRDDVKTLAKQKDLEEVKQDVKVIRAAVIDLSSQVNDHEKRLTSLEAA